MSETPVPADVAAEEEDVKSPTYTPIFVTLERESTTDSFGVWIGATEDGRQVLTKVEGDMAKVLLKVGDEIMAIDNSPVSSMFSHPDLPAVLNHDSLLERITAATTMKLTILREDSDEEEDIPVRAPTHRHRSANLGPLSPPPPTPHPFSFQTPDPAPSVSAHSPLRRDIKRLPHLLACPPGSAHTHSLPEHRRPPNPPTHPPTHSCLFPAHLR